MNKAPIPPDMILIYRNNFARCRYLYRALLFYGMIKIENHFYIHQNNFAQFEQIKRSLKTPKFR